MESKTMTHVVKDFENKSTMISREFNAPLANVWRADTEPELLGYWWAPKPWKAETKETNFVEGGHWLYIMVGPNNERYWGKMSYVRIDLLRGFEIEDGFCDENGTVNPDLPVS